MAALSKVISASRRPIAATTLVVLMLAILMFFIPASAAIKPDHRTKALVSAQSRGYSAPQSLADAGPQRMAQESLIAQQQATYWTRFAAIVGLAQAILSLIGIAFVWRTLIANRKAVEEAAAGNAAAREAIGVSREVGRAQVRAYLSIKSTKMRLTPNVSTNALAPSIKNSDPTDIGLYSNFFFELSNTGQSPATRVFTKLSLAYHFYVYDSERPYVVSRNGDVNVNMNPDELSHVEGEVISAGESRSIAVTSGFFLTKSESSYIRDHNENPMSHMVVIISLHYMDVFNNIHVEDHAYWANLKLSGDEKFVRLDRCPLSFFGNTEPEFSSASSLASKPATQSSGPPR